MAGSLGLPYIPIVGKMKDNPKNIAMDNDIIVNIQELEKIISTL